jgi:hypothetical protein
MLAEVNWNIESDQVLDYWKELENKILDEINVLLHMTEYP